MALCSRSQAVRLGLSTLIRYENEPGSEKGFDPLRDQRHDMAALRRERQQDAASRADAEARLSADPTGGPLPVWLGRDYKEIRRSLSPSGRDLLIVVREPEVDAAGRCIYVVANRTHPGNYEVYRVPVAGSNK